jgi:hypothetical protein
LFLGLETVLNKRVPVYLVTLVRMVPVAEAEGVKLHCPEDGRYAFFNSPYPPHKLNSSVDLYPVEPYGGDARSPVDGEVVLLRKVKAPSGHGFEAADHDSVIVVRNKDNPDTVTKMLHTDPLVQIGDTVKVGDVIGTTLRSGYYGAGTSPHIHTEIRRPDDPIRARGGYRLKRIDDRIGEPVSELTGEVVDVQPEYTFIRLNSTSTGLVGEVNDTPAILDGGIPYYRWMGAHLQCPPAQGEITLLGKTIGNIIEVFDGSCKADCTDFSFSVDNNLILGLSLTLQPRKETLVKIYPRRTDVFEPSVGDWLEVKLNA